MNNILYKYLNNNDIWITYYLRVIYFYYLRGASYTLNYIHMEQKWYTLCKTQLYIALFASHIANTYETKMIYIIKNSIIYRILCESQLNNNNIWMIYMYMIYMWVTLRITWECEVIEEYVMSRVGLFFFFFSSSTRYVLTRNVTRK